MDFQSPKPILDALSAIIDNGHLGYPFPKPEFYEAVHRFLLSKGWDVDVMNSLQNGVGIYTSIWTAIDSLSSLGDEIIYQTPVHFCFRAMIEDNGRVGIENPLKYTNGAYTMDFEHLEKCFTPKTKLFWLCNPHNPVGRAWSRDELEKLSDICIRHNVPIISDDVYCGHLFKGTVYTPIASISKESAQNTITFYSTSKSYNTTGVKHSYMIAENKRLFDACYSSLKKQDLHFGVNLFGLAATTAAYNECDAWLEQVMGIVAENKSFIADFLRKEMPKAFILQSDSTFFAWINFSCLCLPPESLSQAFEKEGHVEVGNGLDLGTGGAGWIRLNMGCPKEVVVEAMARMKNVYEHYVR